MSTDNKIICTDRERIQITLKGYNDYSVKDPFKANDQDELSDEEKAKNREERILGYVAEVYNKSTGEQSYVITDIELPKNPTKADYKKVQEVIILYRGSTGIQHILKDPVDVKRDWINNDALMGYNILVFNHVDESIRESPLIRLAKDKIPFKVPSPYPFSH